MKREMNKRKAPTGVRIIGGSLKRSKIAVIEREGLRPTPDRVRETVFNWLMPAIPGAVVVDCFAGSGVLGLEALSRGAETCTFFENNAVVAGQITSHIERFHLTDRASVIITDVFEVPDETLYQADLIFEAMFLAGKLDTPGKGIMFMTKLDRVATYIPDAVLNSIE